MRPLPLHYTPYTIHHTLYTLHPTPYTLHRGFAATLPPICPLYPSEPHRNLIGTSSEPHRWISIGSASDNTNAKPTTSNEVKQKKTHFIMLIIRYIYITSAHVTQTCVTQTCVIKKKLYICSKF